MISEGSCDNEDWCNDAGGCKIILERNEKKKANVNCKECRVWMG